MPIPCRGVGRGQPGVVERHQRRGESDLREAVEPAGLLRGHEIERLEIDFGGDARREGRRVEAGDRARTADRPRLHAVPESIDAVADRRDGADAR